MTFEELQTMMYDAWKKGEKDKKEALASVINTAKNVAIAENKKNDITEDIVMYSIKKELKTAKEQVETCPPERTKLLKEYTIRKNIIEELMPAQLKEEEIRKELDKNFKELLESKNKGAIMKEVMPYFKDKADGKLVNNIVSEYLR